MEREKMEAHPNEVSAVSSVHQVFGEKGVEEPEKEEDMLAGVKEDLVRSPHWHLDDLQVAKAVPENNQGNLRTQ